jgi:hypothetical protein
MKAIQLLKAIMLLGALSVGFNVAVAKGRDRASDAGSRAMKSSDGGEKSGGNRVGEAKSSTATPGNNAGANQNVRGPVNAGTMKQGNNLRGKTGLQNVGSTQSKNNERDFNSVYPRSADAGPGTPVIADGPGRKTNRPADTTKKTTMIVRPHVVRQPQRPTGLGKIERNSIGAVIHHDASPKFGLDPKVNVRVNGVPAGAPGATRTKTIPNAGNLPNATVRPPGHNLTNPPQHAPIINGSSVNRLGSNVTSIGGQTKNIALSGNTFKPKHP